MFIEDILILVRSRGSGLPERRVGEQESMVVPKARLEGISEQLF